jgi:hypothetical protein
MVEGHDRLFTGSCDCQVTLPQISNAGDLWLSFLNWGNILMEVARPAWPAVAIPHKRPQNWAIQLVRGVRISP